VGLSDIHTGIGEPQYRLREIDQSRAPSSHLPNWPSRTCSGNLVISRLSSTMRSRYALTCKYHESSARWMSGFPQRQQCG
jgi:hypothetical protein